MSTSNFISKQPIGKVLDITMLLLLAFTSCVLLSGDSQYHHCLIFLMFAYFAYFIKFRLWIYLSTKRGYTLHEVQSQCKMEDTNNQSIFLTQFSKRSLDKSKREKDSSNNSLLSLMNRSKTVQLSLSSAKESKKTTGFDFLADHAYQGKKLLKQNFSRDSQRKNTSIHQLKMDDKEKQIEKLMKQCMTKYSQTLRKIQKQNYVDFCQSMRKNIAKMKRKSLKFALQVYNAYLRNLKSIVELLQQAYQVRILCRNFYDLERSLEGTSKSKYFSCEIDIVDVIDKILNSKQLCFSERKVQNSNILKVFSAKSTFATLNSIDSTKPFEEKLRILREDLLNLNSYFYNQEVVVLNAEQIFVNLKLLKECQHESFTESYETQNQPCISQEHSEKLQLIFSITRNKINEIVGEMSLALQFHRATFMGWIQNSQKQFEVFPAINSDLGHPHFDIKINIHPKETLHCIYGTQNGYSCLVMYLWAISRRSPQAVRKNLELSNLIYEIVGPSVLM